METSLKAQALELLLALGLGLAAAFVYELLGTFRRRLGSVALSALLDLAFWIAVTAALFGLYMVAGGGRLNLWALTLAALGALLCRLLLGPAIRAAAGLLADIIAFIFHILCWPLAQLGKCLKKIRKNAKKIFSNSKK